MSNEDDDHSRAKQHVEHVLEHAETVVEEMRQLIFKMEGEIDNVCKSIDSIKNSCSLSNFTATEKDEVYQRAERIISRCNDLQITVHTTRDEIQQNCLRDVNSSIDKIIKLIQVDPDNARSICRSYLDACGSSGHNYDIAFEKVVLGCTLDDQKRIRKRLQGLYDYIVSTYGTVEFPK
ncbi:BAG family molecular chaperone regulator 2-like isoform X2 [Adelges cooleyi]|nr:BAG family molecular chaperone regulator 2-like isoform X2 [Adelges cooleyi]